MNGWQDRWICLLCKSSTPGRHGTLDDGVTPCPESKRPMLPPAGWALPHLESGALRRYVPVPVPFERRR